MTDDRRIGADGDDDTWADEGCARDRIAALAKGFRRLSDDLQAHAADLDRRYRYVARLCVISATLSLVTLVGGVFIERQRAKQQSITSLGAATYRVCQRGDNDRAYAQWRTHGPADLRRVRALLPILDCRPNTEGRPAHPFSNAEQDDFVRRFVAGELSPRERGICRDRLPTGPGQPVC